MRFCSKVREYYIILGVLFLLTLVLCDKEIQKRSAFDLSAKKIQVCGSRLTDMLYYICGGDFNYGKKSDPSWKIWGLRNALPAEEAPSQEMGLSFPIISELQARNTIQEFRRRRRGGIVQECCDKRCSFYEMSTYCRKSN